MINVENLTNNADNTITINGVTFMVTDAVAGTILKLCKGEKVNAALKAEKQTDSKKFPALGKPTDIIGNITVYADSLLVRYWETGFIPDKVKYGIKMNLKDAGCEWDKDMGAFKFPNKTAMTKWIKAQKERAKKAA